MKKKHVLIGMGVMALISVLCARYSERMLKKLMP